MLRASSEKQSLPLELASIGNPVVDSGVRAGAELLAAVDAAVLRDDLELAEAREALVAAVGEAGAVRAFATAGNFEMMNRLLDAQGVMPGEDIRSIGDEIGRPFVDPHAANNEVPNP